MPLFCPHQPTYKQLLFLSLNSLEAFYGGAAGGGKSDALLMAALQYVDVPKYAAIIFRRTYADLALPGALMSRAQEWLAGTAAKWRDTEKTWTFPPFGATLTFGYLENEQDKYRYQSSEFQSIGFDELTQFSESQYRYLFSRLRRLESSNVPLRMRTASNPGGVGHEWVKQRFMVEGKEQGRPFIPARMGDNPYLDRASYEKSLNLLDHITRAQLKEGDWSAAAAGNKFQRQWFEIVDAAPVDLRSVRYWDLAATEAKPGKDPDWTAGCRMGRTKTGIYYLADIKRMRNTPAAIEALVLQTARLDGTGVNIYMEQEPGSSGVNTIDHYHRSVLQQFAFYGVKTTGSKEIRSNPLSAQAEAGNVKLVRGPWINAFLDEAEIFPNGAHDDQIDAASGAYEQLTTGRQYAFGVA